MKLTKPSTWAAAIVFAFATVNALQFYIITTKPYLDTSRYLTGTERLPFQERVLPIPFLRLLLHAGIAKNGVFGPPLFASFLLSLLSFAVATVFVVLLYRAASRTRQLEGLVAPLFLALMVATYVIRPAARFFYPYDMPSVAFFAAGMFFIYRRRYLPLLLVILVGTFNRETTLFLIVIYMLDAAVAKRSMAGDVGGGTIFGLRWQQIPWVRSICLVGIWVAIRLVLGHIFKDNDRSEVYGRFRENLHKLSPGFLPSILNICGYVLPVVFLRRKSLGSDRMAAWLLVTPMWIMLMFFVGVITETRIYGELVPLAAVAATLILEENRSSRDLPRSVAAQAN